MKAETRGIHGGYEESRFLGSSAVPIFSTVSYAHLTAEEIEEVFAGKKPGYIYTRISNPTTSILETRIAELEGGIGCIATSSGMGAISATIMALLKSGEHLVSASGIFGGTISLFDKTLKRFGVDTTFVDSDEAEDFESAVNEKTKAIFIEAIGNPKMNVVDIPGIAEVARKHNIPLILDNTLISPYILKGYESEADIVIHSSTKYINGHGTAMGGLLTDTGRYDWSSGSFDDIRELSKEYRNLAFLVWVRNLIYRDLGCCPSPVNSFFMLQGLETLCFRMEKHVENARRLAKWLEENKDVKWVNYPGLPSSPYYGRVEKLFNGKGGGLLTFGLGSREKAFRFINSLEIAKNLANLGDAKTLVIHPASTIFHEFSDEEREAMGVTEDMIRVSVGIENIEDIIGDFDKAITTAMEE